LARRGSRSSSTRTIVMGASAAPSARRWPRASIWTRPHRGSAGVALASGVPWVTGSANRKTSPSVRGAPRPRYGPGGRPRASRHGLHPLEQAILPAAQGPVRGEPKLLQRLPCCWGLQNSSIPLRPVPRRPAPPRASLCPNSSQKLLPGMERHFLNDNLRNANQVRSRGSLRPQQRYFAVRQVEVVIHGRCVEDHVGCIEIDVFGLHDVLTTPEQAAMGTTGLRRRPSPSNISHH